MRSFFSLDDKPKDKTAAESPDAVKQKEIRKISGHDGIESVAASAPSSVGSVGASAGSGSAGKSAAATAPARKATKAEIEADAKAKERAAARERIGRYWAKRLTNTPYDMWARILQDNDMRLTEAEANELAEDLFMTIDAFDVDPTNKWMLLGGLMFTHGAVISARISILKKKDDVIEATIVQ